MASNGNGNGKRKAITKPDNAPTVVKKMGRPPKEGKTIEEEIAFLHSKIYKLTSRINGIEELVMEIKEKVDGLDTETEETENASEDDIPASDKLDRIDENVTEIKEMLHQLLDSIGEEE